LFWKRYEHVFKIFRTDTLNILKLTIRPIGRHHPRSSFLPHADTGLTVSSINVRLPGNYLLSECQALFTIQHGSPKWYQTGVLFALTFRNRASYIEDRHPLPSKHPILRIYSTNIPTEFFKHAAQSPFFSLQNAVYLIMLPFLDPVLFAFYMKVVLKFKCQILVPKG
jgi:hypothetical protein